MHHKISTAHDANPALRGFQNAGSTVSSHEVQLKITRYIEWERLQTDTDNVLNLSYDMDQDLLAPADSTLGGINSVLCRVSRCKVSAYPRAVSAGNAESIFAVLSAVPNIAGGSGNLVLSNQEVVVVPPTFTPQWHRVFDCDLDELYSSAQISTPDQKNMPLVNLQVVEPINLAPILGQKILLKWEIWVAQTVPLRSEVKLGVNYQNSFISA